jgi:excisionase family DNA binding protein
MNPAVNTLFAEYLEHTGGDKAAAASLTLAAVMQDYQPAAPEKSPPDDSGSLTVKEAAGRLKLSSKKIYQMCVAGQLRCFRAGRAIRVPIKEIERFENESAPPPSGSKGAYRCLTCD